MFEPWSSVWIKKITEQTAMILQKLFGVKF